MFLRSIKMFKRHIERNLIGNMRNWPRSLSGLKKSSGVRWGEKWDYTCPPSSRFTCCRTKPSRFPAIDWSRGTDDERAVPRAFSSGKAPTAQRGGEKGRYFEYFHAIRSRSLSELIVFTLMWPITETWSHSYTRFNYSEARLCQNFQAHDSQSKRTALCRVGARVFSSKTLILAAGSRKVI